MEELKKNLRRGDYITISEATGYKRDTVEKVINGRRNNKKIVLAAEMLLQERAAFITRISSSSISK